MKNITEKFVCFIVWLVVTFVCSIPGMIYFGIRGMLTPTGFWQEFATAALSFYVLGGIQFILAIVWLCVTYFLIFEK